MLLTDSAGVVGLGFRTAGSFMAVVTILFYIFKRDLSVAEAMMSLRLIIITEAVYFLSLLPSGLWGFTYIPYIATSKFSQIFVIETGIPCLVESIAIPIVLTKLFLELNPKKLENGAMRARSLLFEKIYWNRRHSKT